MKKTLLALTLASLMGCEMLLADSPRITIKSGRYYLLIDGERYQVDGKDKWYGLSTTAEAAAINLAFETGKVVVIEQPNLTVTAFWLVVVPDIPIDPEVPVAEPMDVLLTWDQPVEREDGTALLPQEITGYVVMMDEVVIASIEGNTTKYLAEDLTAGVHYFSVATVAEVQGRFSEIIAVDIDAG